jgi:CRP/FNR family transcriptional regulator, cyclic AMP receptor protein
MQTLESIVLAQQFFAGIDPDIGAFIAGCARNHHFEPGTYLFHEGDEAKEFYLVRHGDVSLEVTAPGRRTFVLGTVHEGDIVGASWLAAPYRWTSDARARSHVRALGFDAECLRNKCESDPRTGYELMKRFAPLMVARLQAAHLQLLDVYGRPEGV